MSAAEPVAALGSGFEGASLEPYRQLRPGPGRSAAEVTSHQMARIDRALVEIVAEYGYASATVREIAKLAGISTRAFYEQYSGKEEAFLSVHRCLARKLVRWAGAVVQSTGQQDEQLEILMEAILERWGQNPRATRFLLLGPYGAGPTAMKQSRLLEHSLGNVLARCFDYPRTGSQCDVPRLIGEGIAAGLGAAVRAAMADEGGVQWSDRRRQELSQWALSYACLPSDLHALATAQAQARQEAASRQPEIHPSGLQLPPDGSERALLQAAVAKLVAGGESEVLTPREVCVAAGVSRRCFDVHFSSVDNCLVATADLMFGRAIKCAVKAGDEGSAHQGKFYSGLANLCSQIASDPALAALSFGDFIESSDSLLLRDRLLANHTARLLETSLPVDQLDLYEPRTSLGAALGLIRSEVVAGQAAGLRWKSPVLAHLILAPTVEVLSAIRSMCSHKSLAVGRE